MCGLFGVHRYTIHIILATAKQTYCCERLYSVQCIHTIYIDTDGFSLHVVVSKQNKNNFESLAPFLLQ